MSIELVCAPPQEVAQIWPHISFYIRRAMERGGMGSFESVEKDVLDFNAYLWLAIDGKDVPAVAVTKVTAENGVRLCTIVACGGHDWGRFGSLIEGLEKYARTEGCQRMEICGRPGWLRRLPNYRLAKIVIRKELN